MSANLIATTSDGGFATSGNITGDYFIGNGSQLTGITSTANTGNVTFNDVTVQGDDSSLRLSTGPTYTADSAYLQVRSGDVATHIHFDTGNNQAYDQYIGNDNKYLKLALGTAGNVSIGTYQDGGIGQLEWVFDSNGNLILAHGNGLIQSFANSSLDPNTANASTMIFTPDQSYSSQALVLDPTAPGHIHLRAPATLVDEPFANIFLGGEITAFEVTSGANNQAVIHSGGNDWAFGNDGNLTIPGTLGGFIKTVANASIGIAAMDNGTNNPAQLMLLDAGTGTAATIISAYNSNATIQTNASATMYTWSFNDDGTLSLPTSDYGYGQLYTTGANLYLGDSNNPISIQTDGSVTSNGNLTINRITATGNINLSNASSTLIYHGANNYINLNNDGGLDLACNTEVTITTNYGDSPNRAYSHFYANGTFSTGAIVANGNISANNIGNVAATNFDGSSSNVLLGNGVFAGIPSPTSIVNGTSNVVVSSSGNVTVGVAGTANVITATSTGANITGTLHTTGNITVLGDIIGPNSNVTLVAGSYSTVFDNTGVATMPGNLTVTGNASVTGTSSNVVRRAFGLVAADTYVQLDDLKARVTSSTSQLSLILASGSWQGTGWTETFTSGTPSVSNWVNLPLSSGYDNASGAMNSQGQGCRCVISDQTPSAKVYQITAVRSGTTGALWNISIERLV